MLPPHATANLTANISGLADFALVGCIIACCVIVSLCGSRQLSRSDYFCMQATDANGLGARNYDSAFGMGALYFLQSKCTPNSTLSFEVQNGPEKSTKGEVLNSPRYTEKANTV